MFAVGVCFAESAVGEGRDNLAAIVPVAHDVTVAVVPWDVKLVSGGVWSGGVGDGDIEQAADTSCAAARTGEVVAPVVFDDTCCAIGVGDDFLDEHPAVVEERMRRLRGYLLNASVKVVVCVGIDTRSRMNTNYVAGNFHMNCICLGYCALCIFFIIRGETFQQVSCLRHS